MAPYLLAAPISFSLDGERARTAPLAQTRLEGNMMLFAPQRLVRTRATVSGSLDFSMSHHAGDTVDACGRLGRAWAQVRQIAHSVTGSI